MAKLTITYWRDIPSQVTAQSGRKRAKGMLDKRFQEAIDLAAMRTKATNSDAYLEDWRRGEPSLVDHDGDLDDLVKQTITRLESEIDQPTLEKIVKNGGKAI